MLIYIGTVIAFLLLLLLYRYLPRRIFALFCLMLALSSAIVFYCWPRTQEQQPAMTAEEKYALVEQQQIFSAWYADYQKDIDALDRNWRRYHQILETFKEGQSDIQTTHLLLAQLDNDSQILLDRITAHTPPIPLNGACYDLLTEVVKKTVAYADAQHRTIALTKAAADPAALHTTDPAEQSRLLQSVMIRESPVGLFTADEITQIRDALSIPKDNEPAP